MAKHRKADGLDADVEVVTSEECESCGGTGFCPDGCCDCPDCTSPWKPGPAWSISPTGGAR
jgi:hypothetical protein